MNGSPIYILTFLTRSRQCCFYATEAEPLPGGSIAPPELPDQVETQLAAMGAQVAWMYVGPPADIRVMGAAHSHCDPVTSATSEQMGHLVMCGSERDATGTVTRAG